MSFDDGTFDAVYMMEVLEHVKDPQAALSEVRRVLKDGGRFVLSTPFVFGIHEEPWDFRRFTRHGLEHLLTDYEIGSIRARNHYYRSIIVLFMRSIFSPGRKRSAVVNWGAVVRCGMESRMLRRVLVGMNGSGIKG